jgi:amidase
VTGIAFMSAAEQARAVKAGELSPVDLVSEYLARIEALDSDMNSFVTLAGERAMEEARAAERAGAREDPGPLHGVPVSIKDLHDTAGIRTTHSSTVYSDNIPEEDSSTVRRLRTAGAIVLGKTNAPELGTWPVTESDLNGVCRNPWDLERTAGGSSGGAAASLAAGLCALAHGSDGGGSIRIPASCCGVFGLKPARGRVSRAPNTELFASLSVEGPLARTVEDAALMLDVVSGYEPGDPYWAPGPDRPFREEVGAAPGRLRIAFTTEPPIEAPVEPACVRAVEEAAGLLESLGHHVESARPDWHDDLLFMHFFNLWILIPAAYGVVDYSLLETTNRAFGDLSEQTSAATVVRSARELGAIARRIVTFWNDYDLLLTPTLSLEPVPIGWLFEDPDPGMQFARAAFFTPFTPPFNLTGQPAASLPLHWSDSGLPVGVQLVGAPAGEATLLRVCAQMEEARPWAERIPQIAPARAKG